MDAKQIANMGKEVTKFLAEFDDCFGRSQPRQHLRTYIGGQLSDLPRKSVEPIALAAGVPPRTLQRFLASVHWDDRRMVDRTQWMVARDHAHRQAIGVVDETGNPKKGKHTAGVQRQWCGNTGKIDNCLVSVHLSYVAGDFQCLLDSDVYLPQQWANDPARRKEAGIGDDVEYRKKTTIALGQIRRALGNGIRVAAWTFDEWYGRDGDFLDGLDALGQSYVGEVPSTFTGWSHQPQVLQTPRSQEGHKRGPKRRYPRLARKALDPSQVQNLVTYSRAFQNQKWKRFKIKDGQKGPIVWEVKYAPFYRRQGDSRLPGPMHTLIVARNVLNPDKVKYFLSNMVPGANGVSLEWMLWVAFCRWPVERCFELGKRDMGMDHFETRSWRAIHRHFYITQLSLLFCARVHQRLREKNDRQFIPDRRAGSPRRRRLDGLPRSAAAIPKETLSRSRQTNRISSGTEPMCSHLPHKKDRSTTSQPGHRSRSIELVYTG
ncbi:MAG: IS701 family transposase [Terriglobia bacterium]